VGALETTELVEYITVGVPRERDRKKMEFHSLDSKVESELESIPVVTAQGTFFSISSGSA